MIILQHHHAEEVTAGVTPKSVGKEKASKKPPKVPSRIGLVSWLFILSHFLLKACKLQIYFSYYRILFICFSDAQRFLGV